MGSEGENLRKIETPGVIEISDFDWSPDSEWLVYISKAHNKYNINVISLSSKVNSQLTDTSEFKRDPRWSSDGKNIAYFSMRSTGEGDIAVISLSDRKITKATSALKGVNSYPRWSPESNTLAFVSDCEGMKKIGLISFPGLKITWLPKDDYEENFPEWSPRGRKLLFISNRNGNMVISIYSLLTGKLHMTGFSKGVTSSARWSPDGKLIAFRYHSSLTCPELFVTDGEKIRKLTTSLPEGLKESEFMESRMVSYLSTDNTEIFAFLYTPQTSGPHPAIVWVHGGPASQHFNGWNSFIQIILSRGIAVLAPNIRGSTGRGREFENALYRDWGGVDLEDIISAGKYLKTLPFINSEKVALGGTSYGGYMTMTGLVKAPRLWAAGINAVGPVNLATFYKNTSKWFELLLRDKYGFLPPEDDREFYHERSPLNFISNLKAPLLLIYNKHDVRVPIEELDQLLLEFKKYKKEYELLLFSDEGHSFENPLNELKRYKAISDFLSRVLL